MTHPTIADRLRTAGQTTKADKLDRLANDWWQGRVSAGEFAIEFWRGVRVLRGMGCE